MMITVEERQHIFHALTVAAQDKDIPLYQNIPETIFLQVVLHIPYEIKPSWIIIGKVPSKGERNL